MIDLIGFIASQYLIIGALIALAILWKSVVIVGGNEIAVLERKYFDDSMPKGHDAFQDGESFLKNGGEKGPQIQILPPGNYRVNPALFKVKKVPAVTIGQNEVGLISSTDV